MKISKLDRNRIEISIVNDDCSEIRPTKDGKFIRMTVHAGKYSDIPYYVYLSRKEIDKIIAAFAQTKESIP